MRLFHILTIIISLIVFFGLFIYTFVTFHEKNKSFPPDLTDCPDYWKADGSGNNTTCTNIKDLGSCPASSGQQHLVMNFNDPLFTGTNGSCAKYTWAKNCNISWDAVTYGVNNPCHS